MAPHGDPLRATLGVDCRTIDFLAVDFPALEKRSDLLQLLVVFGNTQLPAIFRFEFGAKLRFGEPVFAISPADHVTKCRQRPIVGCVLWPLGIPRLRSLE